MNMEENRSAIVEKILREIQHLDPTLGDEQTHLLSQKFLPGDEEAILFLFLEIARRLKSSAPSPSTPSGMIPPHLKASA
ncbi:MAG: hypothetical protein ACE15F_20465 [bacterium]